MNGLIQDVRIALRVMDRNRGVSTVAVLTMALGIGATTAIFSLLNGILLKPLPYPDSDRLVSIGNTLPGAGIDQVPQSAALHFTYEDQSTAFASLGLWSSRGVTITGLGEAQRELAILTTRGILAALRIRPSMGRVFSEEDVAPGAPCTAILSDRYWQSAFGGDKEVLGKTLQADGEVCEIIGISPEGNFIYDLDPALYLPLRIDRSTAVAGEFRYPSLARLAPGVSVEQAKADMIRLIPVHIEVFPDGMTEADLEESELAPTIRLLKTEVLGNVGSRIWVIFGASGLLLFIAVANVANLVLVRFNTRNREVAVRTAMGASRGRVVRQFLVEGTCQGLLGGVIGIMVAFAGLELIRATSPGGLPRLNEVSLDLTVMAFTIAVSLAVGLFFGLFPVMRRKRSHLLDALKDGGGRGVVGHRQHATRHALAAIQIAVSLILLIGSGLMLRSLLSLHAIHPGFDNPENVLTLRINIPYSEIADLDETIHTHEMLAGRIAELPGVMSVGLTSKLPMSPGYSANRLFVEEFPVTEGSSATAMQYTWVGSHYFETMGIPLVAGRQLTRADIRDGNPVVVVSESMVRTYWTNPGEAVGKRISGGREAGEGGWREIVGVVGDVRDDGVTREPPPIIYWPLLTRNPMELVDGIPLQGPRLVSYAIRSERAGTAEFLQEVRDAIGTVNTSFPAERVRMLDEILASGRARTSFMLAMIGIAATIALVLGIVGAYGVISFIVNQRSQEFGLRLAVGAEPSSLLRLVLKQGFVLAAAGVGLGLLVAFWMTNLLEAFLFGVEPFDAVTFSVVAASLLLTTVLACLSPAHRAARIDPVQMLRNE